MPSIPQSLLWISLVVLWLFVLVPMLISKREAVRRTSDVALATRVLNSATAARLLRRGGPAAGHRSDPDWQPEESHDDILEDDHDADASPRTDGAVVAVAAAVVEPAGPDYLDVDVVDEPAGALPAGDGAADDETAPIAEQEPAGDDADTEVVAEYSEDPMSEDADEEMADEYETVDDTSGIPVAEEQPESMLDPVISRRHRYDSQTAAAVSARKYAFRRRMLLAMALMLVASAAAAFMLKSVAWWPCISVGTVTVLYLGYLRRQTRIEARVRRRRMQRMARSRLGVVNTHDREFDVVPSRLQRPGAAVLEIDDEDPAFEHLDYAAYARDYGWHRDLPRAAGQ